MNSNESTTKLMECPDCSGMVSIRATVCPKCDCGLRSKCLICQEVILINSVVCPKCGDPDPFQVLPENHNFVFCTKCGDKCRDYLDLCSSCGKLLTKHIVAGRSKLIPCPFCSKDVSNQSTQCPYCDTPSNQRCQVCNEIIASESESCPKCGDPRPFGERTMNKSLHSTSVDLSHSKNKANFCTGCGNPRSYEWDKFCRYCNKPFPSNTNGYSRMSFSATNLQGVKGWLLFLCILLTIITPLLTCGGYALGWSVFESHFKMHPSFMIGYIVEMIIGAGVVACGVTAGSMLWTIRPNAIIITKIFLVVALVNSLIPVFVFIDIPYDLKDAIEAEYGKSVAQGIISFAIWFTYLCLSKRVKATYKV